MSHNCGCIFAEERHNVFLLPNSRRTLVTRVYEFLIDNFSYDPTSVEMIDIAHATVSLFPSLKVNESCIGGIVRVIYRSKYEIFSLNSCILTGPAV